MNSTIHPQLDSRKRRILRRIENQPGVEHFEPMLTASNIRDELSDRIRAISPGGIVALIQIHCQMARMSRRILYRLLSRNPWQGVFLRLLDRLHDRRLC